MSGDIDEVDPGGIIGGDSGGNDRLGVTPGGDKCGVDLCPTGVGVHCLDTGDSGGVDDTDSPVWSTALTAVAP